MVIYKILNNNLILSRDGQGHEVIVKGCGIAFQKKKGQQVEESRIEKIFTAENAQISKEIQGYLTAIPEKYLDFVEAFVNEVKEKEGMKLNDVGVKTINKFNPIPYSTLKNSYFVVYRRGLGNI